MSAIDTEPGTDQQAELRARLHDAIAQRKAVEKTLAKLTQAQDDAHLKLRHSESRRLNANEDLRREKAEERSRLAYGFASGGVLTDDPVAKHQAIVAEADAEIAQLKRIEGALAGEIDQLQRNLNTLTHNVYGIMADLVTGSDEYQLLVKSQVEAFVRLRSIKLALREVIGGLHGYCPQTYLDLPYLGEPVSDRRSGFSVDETIVSAWASAMAQLADDASVDLPLFAE